MANYEFSIHDVKMRAHTSSGRHASIKLSGCGGILKLETWLQGCGMNGLEGFMGTYAWPAEAVPAFLEYLKDVDTSAEYDGGGTYKNRRYFFSLSDSNLFYEFPKALAAKAKKLETFENLAHGPNKVHLYLLTV